MAETSAVKRSAAFADVVERSAPGWLERYQIPDAAVAIVEDDEVGWSKRFGDSRGDLFEVASLSKTATSLAVLSLVEQGKIDLDRPVNDYLERWKVTSSEFDADGVTTRRLLDHTAGLPVGFPKEDVSRYPDIVDQLEGRTPIEAAEIVTAPGTAFAYSNPGYGVLELLIEEVTGNGYRDAMRTLVFEPLGMHDTGFQDDEEFLRRVVPGFRKAGVPFAERVRFPRAAGGILSTAKDIGRLLVGVSRPKGEGGLLKEASLEEMRTLEKASTGAFGLKDGGYALGIAQSKMRRGGVFVANNGSHEGFNALLLSVPNEGVGFVVLTNSATGIGVELELALSFFDRVVGDAPAIATTFSRFRTGARVATAVALLFCLLFLARVGLGVRRGDRTRAEALRPRKLVLKTIPLAVLGAGLFAVFDTGLLTSELAGLAPARFISDEYRFVVAGLAACLVAIGAAATAVPKRAGRIDERELPATDLRST
jgi:CubicO group peptidase (beta-lactamase class C family)